MVVVNLCMGQVGEGNEVLQAPVLLFSGPLHLTGQFPIFNGMFFYGPNAWR